MASNPKDSWDRALIISQIVGAVITPIAVTVVGAFIAYSLTATTKERELSAQEMAQALSVLQLEKDDSLKAKLHTWAVDVVNHRVDEQSANAPSANILGVAATNRELAENLCYKPSDVLLAPADALPLIHRGDDLIQVYAQTVHTYSEVRWRYNRLIRSLKIGCGYLNKTPNQLQDLIDSTK